MIPFASSGVVHVDVGWVRREYLKRVVGEEIWQDYLRREGALARMEEHVGLIAQYWMKLRGLDQGGKTPPTERRRTGEIVPGNKSEYDVDVATVYANVGD